MSHLTNIKDYVFCDMFPIQYYEYTGSFFLCKGIGLFHIMALSSFNEPPVDGYLGCFWFFPITINTLMSVCVYVFASHKSMPLG